MHSNLGEFEELVLLTVAKLYDDAYGVAIMENIDATTERTPTISAIHTVLSRLEKKELVESRLGGNTSARGGRRKRLFTVTEEGQNVLAHIRKLRNQLWDDIPEAAFNKK